MYNCLCIIISENYVWQILAGYMLLENVYYPFVLSFSIAYILFNMLCRWGVLPCEQEQQAMSNSLEVVRVEEYLEMYLVLINTCGILTQISRNQFS